MVNKELLERALQYIEDHPEEWDQKKWICGTSACIAGRTCLLAGDVPADKSEFSWGTDEVLLDGEAMLISVRAQHLLGLTKRQADKLFDSDNDLLDLRYLAGRIIAGTI